MAEMLKNRWRGLEPRYKLAIIVGVCLVVLSAIWG